MLVYGQFGAEDSHELTSTKTESENFIVCKGSIEADTTVNTLTTPFGLPVVPLV